MIRAVESPLVRGGLTLAGGVLVGNVVGFGRVALTAYLLGTHSQADSLAVAMGPLDTLNSVLANSMVFAFVPMLAGLAGAGRAGLFLKLRRAFACLFAAISVAVIAAAPGLMRILAPGLNAEAMHAAVVILRILALSTTAAGVAALYWALLYTERRFGPTAFYQATINLSTIVAALALWKALGVYAFAVGYAMGACVQVAVVHIAARQDLRSWQAPQSEACLTYDMFARPAFFVVYAIGLGFNITFTRAYATHAGPGMAAALEYCMRGVGVPLALVVSPLANSLLPEIAKLKSQYRLKEALRLVDRTVLLAALVAGGGCALALAVREPVIALVYQRGNFTSDSTRLVSAVFLGLAPTLVGWSLIEILARSLFALDRCWPPVIAAAIPVVVNAAVTIGLGASRPQLLGLGASIGAIAGFAVLFLVVHMRRSAWLEGA